MSKLRKYRRKSNEEIEIDLVPIMNMFLVLIPFLLMSACFFHLKVINTSVPVLSEAATDALKEKDAKVTVIVEIDKNSVHLSAVSDSIAQKKLDRWSTEIVKKRNEEYPLDDVSKHLERIKERYPASTTLIIIPEESVIYDTIIQTMDVARYSKGVPLFPNVVLSGKVG